jgi:hypothetical protein
MENVVMVTRSKGKIVNWLDAKVVGLDTAVDAQNSANIIKGISSERKVKIKNQTEGALVALDKTYSH